MSDVWQVYVNYITSALQVYDNNMTSILQVYDRCMKSVCQIYDKCIVFLSSVFKVYENCINKCMVSLYRVCVKSCKHHPGLIMPR